MIGPAWPHTPTPKQPPEWRRPVSELRDIRQTNDGLELSVLA